MSSGGESAEELVRDLQARTKPDDSFRLLFDRHCPEVKRFFRRKGLSGEDSEDLTQEVFISVYQNIGRLQDAGKFEAWLFRIALNAFRNYLERSKAQKRDGIHVELVPEHSSEEEKEKRLPQHRFERGLDQNLIDDERRRALQDAISSLPEQMRRCLQLSIIYDLTGSEIAPMMGISVNTVKAHLHQARKILTSRLESKIGKI